VFFQLISTNLNQSRSSNPTSGIFFVALLHEQKALLFIIVVIAGEKDNILFGRDLFTNEIT
jgi:hypothetical protein